VPLFATSPSQKNRGIIPPAPLPASRLALSSAPRSAPLPAPFHALLPALFLLLLVFAAGCSSVRKNYPKIPSTALPAPTGTSITKRIGTQLARHPAGHSGFRLLALSSEALTARIALADQAVSSLDVQYYMIHDDPTSHLVLQHVLAAADRGVRVRILIDDIHVAGNDRNILALDAHPSIEVRIFNPFKIRQTFALTIATQFLLDGRRLNRRMHNKSYIIDSQVAIIGGRNIGDEYFDARQDVNFRDLDLLAVGPIVQEITGSFDQFWNSDAAYPLEAFYKHANTSKELNRLRALLQKSARPYPPTDSIRVLFTPAFAINDDPDDIPDDEAPPPPALHAAPAPHSTSAPSRFRWCWAPAQLIADDPNKVNPDDPKKGPHIGEELAKVITAANTEVLLISPYLVPRPQGVRMLADLTKRGVSVKILTNSLVSTDISLVHAGYARYRAPLSTAGVDLYELRPLPPATKKRFFRGKRTGISLHAKAFVIDRRSAFIGSMNIDPRSELLNTEMGVLVESPELAQEIAAFFNEAIEPDSSYQVHLTEPDTHGNRKIYWTGEPDGKPTIYKTDPNAGIWRRIKTTLMRIFPIEGLL
jgi:putative cardiolipin synthase